MQAAEASAAAAEASAAAVEDNLDLLGDPLLYDSTKLRSWRVALGKRANTPVDILVLGDSLIEGQGASAAANRFHDRLLARLRTEYQPAGVTGGEGYVPAAYIATGVTDRWTFTGTTAVREDLGGLGERTVTLAVSATASLTFTGTALKVMYAKGPTAGTFSWAIDGGAATNVIANNATISGGNVVDITGLSDASHTVVVTGLSNTTYLEGAMVLRGDSTSGMRIWGAGHSGWQSDDHANVGVVSAMDSVAAVQPDLVLVHLGLNDYGSQSQTRIAPAAMATNFDTIAANIRAVCTIAPSFVWLIPYERTVVPTVLATWEEYRQAYKDFAANDGQIGLVDIGAAIGSFAGSTDPYGIDAGDFVHPNDAGHQVMADAVFRVIR
jgi:lysophospholipase L1-like esterase